MAPLSLCLGRLCWRWGRGDWRRRGIVWSLLRLIWGWLGLGGRSRGDNTSVRSGCRFRRLCIANQRSVKKKEHEQNLDDVPHSTSRTPTKSELSHAADSHQTGSVQTPILSTREARS